MRNHYQILHIDLRFFFISYPHINGQAELTNKILFNGLKKKDKRS